MSTKREEESNLVVRERPTECANVTPAGRPTSISVAAPSENGHTGHQLSYDDVHAVWNDLDWTFWKRDHVEHVHEQ